MKRKFIKLMSIVMVLFFVAGCGQYDCSNEEKTEVTATPETNTTEVDVDVKVSPSYKLVAQKRSNADLQIDSMRIDVYTADSVTDTDYSNNSLVVTKSFTEVDGKWSITLSGLEKAKAYTFVVSAFNATETTKPIFHGSTTAIISSSSKTDVLISLEQATDLYDSSSDVIPTASHITAIKDANGEIGFSFSLNNPNENVVTWSLFSADGTTLSPEFTPNSGTTSDKITPIAVAYSKAVDLNNTRYVLELNDEDGTTRYIFNIENTTSEEINVTVITAPIIKKIIATVADETITLTPELSKSSSTVTYLWSFLEHSGSESIDNATASTIVISNFISNSELKVRLEVKDGGASSYRIYTIKGYSNSLDFEIQ